MTAICEPTEVIKRESDLRKLIDELCPELKVRIRDIPPDYQICFVNATDLFVHDFEAVEAVKHMILNVIYQQIGMLTTIAESMRSKI